MDLTTIWGNKDSIGPLEIAARSAVMFAYLILLLRFTGMRPFGKRDVFDNVLTILLGAVLARGIVGATLFVSALVAGLVLAGLHYLLAKFTYFSKKFGGLVKGERYRLFSEGKYDEAAMRKTTITVHDVEEELRINCQKDSLAEIKEVYLERTGEVSFVKKQGTQ